MSLGRHPLGRRALGQGPLITGGSSYTASVSLTTNLQTVQAAVASFVAAASLTTNLQTVQTGRLSLASSVALTTNLQTTQVAQLSAVAALALTSNLVVTPGSILAAVAQASLTAALVVTASYPGAAAITPSPAILVRSGYSSDFVLQSADGIKLASTSLFLVFDPGSVSIKVHE